ncbi:hypothetical protein SDC9_145892 [bioreactor metagenome]|uniref:Uncharacterized protein n=1 Tax=bioreactor metagenome TaxID=1076179 RepID=A0A645E9M5_9ZZZZ
MIVAGSIFVMRYEGPIIIRTEASSVPAFNKSINGQLNNMGTVEI